MFLGNLSTATERNARKSSSTKQKSSKTGESNDKTIIDEIVFPSGMPMEDSDPLPGRLPVEERGSRKILYDKDINPDVPRELMFNFLTQSSKAFLQVSVIQEIVAESKSLGVGLYEAAVNYQLDMLEFNYQIERKYGAKCLSQIPFLFPDDEEIQTAAQDFVYAAMRSYLIALNIRAKARGVQNLIKSGEFKRVHILEFFEACNAINAMTELKQHLRMVNLQSNNIPSERIIQIQRSMIEVVGYTADFGVSELNKISQKYASDSEVLTKMQFFAVSAQTACRVATMTDEQRDAFFQQMPPMLRHYPHMFVIQQQQAQQQAMQMAQSRSEATSSLFNSEEGMEKARELLERLKGTMGTVQSREVEKWSDEQREEFFNAFIENNSLLDLMKDAGSDAAARVSKLFELTNEQLVEIHTMQAVMVEDMKSKGSIAKKIREAQVAMWTAAAKASKESGEVLPEPSAVQKLGGLLASLSSLTNFGRSMEYHPPHDHSHSHSHSHGDDHVCPVHPARAPGGVASGKADRMER